MSPLSLPNGGDATTTCNCPEDSKDDFLCALETYDAAKTVTLEAKPTTGSFNKWAGQDCKGQPATCTIDIGPAVKTFYTARGKFKP